MRSLVGYRAPVGRSSASGSFADGDARNSETSRCVDSIVRRSSSTIRRRSRGWQHEPRGALRNLGELARASRPGERFEDMHPDDPKVLRALAAVYGELAEGADELAIRADRLFVLANELEMLDEDDFEFADLTNVTPRSRNCSTALGASSILVVTPSAPSVTGLPRSAATRRNRIVAACRSETSVRPRLHARGVARVPAHAAVPRLRSDLRAVGWLSKSLVRLAPFRASGCVH